MTENKLLLPQIEILYTQKLPSRQYLFVTGGRAPSVAWLHSAAKQRIIWCIDHGIDICKKANLLPEQLIGDGDSAQKSSWQWAMQAHVPIQQYSPKKDLTDTQLALEIAKRMTPPPFILLTGGFGKRLDHTFSTFFSFAASGINGCMSDQHESIFFVTPDNPLQAFPKKKPMAVSLLPVSTQCKGVSIDGMYWPLRESILKQQYPYAISNELTADAFKVSVRQGILALYLYWK